MDHQQAVFQQILNERQPLLHKIFNFFISFAVLGLLATGGSIAAGRDSLLVVANLVVELVLVAVLVWARRAIGQPQLGQRFQVVLGVVLLVNLVGALSSTWLILSFPISLMLCIIIASIFGRFNAIWWAGIIGVLIFVSVGLAESLNGLDWIPERTNDPVSVVITSVLLFVSTIMLLKVFNDILLRSIDETTRRQQDAENARQQATQRLEQVQSQASEQQKLLNLITDLETPAVPVLPGVLILPIVGHLDSHRITRLNDSLLERVSAERASTVLLDLTGVNLVDTATANHLIQMVRSVRLLGTRCILTGVRAEGAQTMVTLGIDWGTIPTSASLQNAIQSILDERVSTH